MSMSIRVAPEELGSVSARLTAGSSSIEGQLGDLASAVIPLLEAEWAGTASDSFRALWQEWQQAGGRLREALEGMAQLMSRAADAYATVEEQVTASFRT